MAFEDGSHSINCPNCQAMHRAGWFRMPFKEPHVLMCLVCDSILQKGNSIRSYESLTLMPD